MSGKAPQSMAAWLPLPRLATELERRARHHVTANGFGGRVVWRVWGEGPVLVLLHGGHGSWLHWSAVIGDLAQSHRVLVPDLPGFGDSDCLPDDHAIKDSAGAIASGLDLIAPRLPVRMIGFSFGGVVAGHVVAQLGERLSHLTIVGSSGMGLSRPPMAPMQKWRGLAPAECASAHGENLSILMLANKSRIGDGEIAIQQRNTALARGKSRPFSLTTTLIDILRLTSPPVDGIWGQQDATARGYIEQRRAALAEVDPASCLIEIAGAGHWVMQEDPKAFLAAYGVIASARGFRAQ